MDRNEAVDACAGLYTLVNINNYIIIEYSRIHYSIAMLRHFLLGA